MRFESLFSSTDSSKSFIIDTSTSTWRDAQSFCRQYHTDLISVRNQTENQLIHNIINDHHTSVWIGLFRDSWEWSDNIDSAFRYWDSGQPDNSYNSEDCSMTNMNNEGKWHDVSCSDSNTFVCHEDELILIQKNLSWTEAVRYCRENHVDLVSVDSQEIQLWVTEVLHRASTAEVWMGLRHFCSLGIWFWVNEEIVFYQNWAPGNETAVGDSESGLDSKIYCHDSLQIRDFVYNSKMYDCDSLQTALVFTIALLHTRHAKLRPRSAVPLGDILHTAQNLVSMLSNTLSVGQPKVGNQSNISVQSAEERRSKSNVQSVQQEMARCGGGQRKLTVIPPDPDGYNGQQLKTVSSNGKSTMYVVPLQEQIDITPLPPDAREFEKMPKAQCALCSKMVPLQCLPVHIKHFFTDKPKSCIRRKIVDWLTPKMFAMQESGKDISMRRDSISSETINLGRPRPPPHSLVRTGATSWERAA
ncbi:hypothetical protein E1301_Tti020708 [Triplophysa tibetana]|uniref:C-type lectin domain-containing protein n=1 Tax=Triplophysa tibetana TaxID=1572043 RepID=A0A5A9PI26_9TELE|nr:hypothetical protein E1301_Tti020708 [Triplophysa tibetana]